jgi:hypothetical protein
VQVTVVGPPTQAAPPDPSSPHITVANAGRIVGLARLGRGIVWDLALNPGGQTLAVASTTGVWLYDLPTLESVRLLEDHTGQLFSVSWPPGVVTTPFLFGTVSVEICPRRFTIPRVRRCVWGASS